ncbi:MAG TPA: hemolysin family protein [Thermoanaerobaculia bacterium]|nr:hemolysin family protein [Thermoanaerobaculia bacterium]
MIAIVSAAFCYGAFLLFESFALALDRLSPIKIRGLLEEHPERARILSGAGEVEIVRTTTKVLVQALLLAGLLTTVSALETYEVPRPWLWGGAFFVVGWMLTEIAILRRDANRDPERIVASLLPLVTAASWLLLPIGFLIRRIFAGRAPAPERPPEATEQEVRAYIDVGRQEGILEKDEEKLLMSIVDFGDTRVREVMTPRTDIVWIDVAASLRVLLDLFVESKYSRIPVVRGSIDTVVGVVHVKDVLEAVRAGSSGTVAAVMREAYFVPETKKVSELLRELQRRHLWMAIVVDEYGGVSGLVTVEDLLEEIVGEISDEHEDEREPVSKAGESAFSVSGKANIEVVRDLFTRGPEGEEFTTVGGFLTSRLGHIPKAGETYRESDLRFTVEEADRRRVHRVRIEPVGSGAPTPAPSSVGKSSSSA